MTSALRHRGPDDEGFFDEGPISLGFRRLAVIDLEKGRQPIVFAGPQLAIVLNGEIYNFRELRADLEGRGSAFSTKGDVEVVLRLWAEEGPSCLTKLNGMFALAVWDGRRHTLHLARDRFGIKPLYVCRQGATLAFASELQALRAGAFPKDFEIDPLQLRHYLAFGYSSPGQSPVKGVSQVPPATLLSIGPDGEESRVRYWSPPITGQGVRSTGEAPEDLLQHLQDAVSRQLVADVPVGVFLSGGLDSSTVTALAGRELGRPIGTFSVGFEGPQAVSELPEARRVAALLGTDHTELTMDPRAVARDLDEILGGLDSPLADPTILPTWYMSRLARERVTVALSGEGADEVFGGYARQRYDVAIDRLGVGGRFLLPGALGLIGKKASPAFRRRLEMPPGLGRQLAWGRVFSAAEIGGLVTGLSSGEDGFSGLYLEEEKTWAELASIDAVNARLYGDGCTFLPGDLLPKVDRMSMAHSLEVRVPFLDNEVVDHVLPMPGRVKIGLFKDKILLRRAASRVLPKAISWRRKQGFEVPISAWLRGPLRPALCEHLAQDRLRAHGVFCEPVVSGMLRDHLTGRHDHGRRLWTLLVFSHWLERSADA